MNKSQRLALRVEVLISRVDHLGEPYFAVRRSRFGGRVVDGDSTAV